MGRLGDVEPLVDEARLAALLEKAMGPAGPLLAPLLLPVLPELLAVVQRPPEARATGALVAVEEAAKRLGIGKTKTKELIACGHLGSVTVGRRRLVPAEAIEAYVAELMAGHGQSASA